jgi:lysophosphatidate acyltransferase
MMMTMIIDSLWVISSYMLKVLMAYMSLSLVGSLLAVGQEAKIWSNPHNTLPNLSLFGMLKVYLLNVTWMVVCLWGSIGVVLVRPFTSSTRPLAHNGVERNVALFIVWMFVGPVIVRGTEHLPPLLPAGTPPTTPAPVLIANHWSQIDAAAVYYLYRSWRWIAKSSVLYLPGVGQIMWLSGHVFIDRSKGSSKVKPSITGVQNLFVQSNQSIQEGIPMFFFPQGTRRMGGPEQLPFRDGAFIIAIDNQAPLIPISVEIPPLAFNSWYPFLRTVDPVVLTVHPAVSTTGKTKEADMEELKRTCWDAIYSVLPDYTKSVEGSKKQD